MELILEATTVDRFATVASASRVAALHHKVLDDAMEDGAVVVALEAQLHKVATRLGRLLGPQLDIQRTDRGVQYELAGGRWLGDVRTRHGGKERACDGWRASTTMMTREPATSTSTSVHRDAIRLAAPGPLPLPLTLNSTHR